MQDCRVLVAGGAGFIGSNPANHLAEDNDVVAVDNRYFGTSENLFGEVKFVEVGVLDTDLPTDIDVVFHLAALSSYAMHEEKPTEGARVNDIWVCKVSVSDSFSRGQEWVLGITELHPLQKILGHRSHSR